MCEPFAAWASRSKGFGGFTVLKMIGSWIMVDEEEEEVEDQDEDEDDNCG